VKVDAIISHVTKITILYFYESFGMPNVNPISSCSLSVPGRDQKNSFQVALLFRESLSRDDCSKMTWGCPGVDCSANAGGKHRLTTATRYRKLFRCVSVMTAQNKLIKAEKTRRICPTQK